MKQALKTEQLMSFATPAAKILLGASVVMAALSMLAQLFAADELNANETVEIALHASTVATMIFAALAGLYSATTDYRFGVTDQRLLSEPNRAVNTIAKSVNAAGVGLLYGLIGGVSAVAVASVFYRLNDESFDIMSGEVGRAVAGTLIASALFAVVGVAVGTLVRSQPMAMGGALVWLLIIEPPVILGFPTIGKWLPGASGLALTNAPDPSLTTQPTGAVMLVVYAVVLSAVAIWRFNRIDV